MAKPIRGSIRSCACGCGQPAAKYYSEGRFKSWRAYAAGHCPFQLVQQVYTDACTEDLAYLAGILDGEGCIYARIYQSKKCNVTIISLSVTMCSEAVVKWIYDNFGGCVYTDVPPGQKRRFSWKVRGTGVAKILRVVLPYLKEKKKRAGLGIELSDLLLERSEHRGKRSGLSDSEKEHRIKLAAPIKALNQNPRGEDEAA